MLSLFNTPASSHLSPQLFHFFLLWDNCRGRGVVAPNEHQNFLTVDKEVRVTSESKLINLILINTVLGIVTAYGS